MTTITRQHVEKLATEHGCTVVTDADLIERPGQLPTCPSWCWEDHPAAELCLRRLYAATGGGPDDDFRPEHSSPVVTFGDAVSLRLWSFPSATDGSGGPAIEINGEVDIPLHLAEVVGRYLVAISRSETGAAS